MCCEIRNISPYARRANANAAGHRKIPLAFHAANCENTGLDFLKGRSARVGPIPLV